MSSTKFLCCYPSFVRKRCSSQQCEEASFPFQKVKTRNGGWKIIYLQSIQDTSYYDLAEACTSLTWSVWHGVWTVLFGRRILGNCILIFG